MNFFGKYYNENINYSFGEPQVDVYMTYENLSTKLKSNNLCDSSKRNTAAELMAHKI